MIVGGAYSTFVWETTFFLEGAGGFVGLVRLRGAGTPSDMLRRLNAVTRVRSRLYDTLQPIRSNIVFFIFNDLAKHPPLPRPGLASNGTTRDPSTSVYFGQTRPHLGMTQAID